MTDKAKMLESIITRAVNSTRPNNMTHEEVYDHDSIGSKTITVYVGVFIAALVCVLVVFLCCKEVRQRRLQEELGEELARREAIKKTVEAKLDQLEKQKDPLSYMEIMKAKVPFVTFGEVTSISPSPSFETLHHRPNSYQQLADEVEGRGGTRKSILEDHHRRDAQSSSLSWFSFVKDFISFKRKRPSSWSSSSSNSEIGDHRIMMESFETLDK